MKYLTSVWNDKYLHQKLQAHCTRLNLVKFEFVCNAPLHEVRSEADHCWLLQLYRSVPDIASKVTGGQTYSSTVQAFLAS